MDYQLTHSIIGDRGAGILRLTPQAQGSRSTVVVLHGLGSAKERTLTAMYHLAATGFDVLAIDLFLHGDRPETIYRQQMLDSDFVTAMRDIIYESVADVPAVCEELGVDITQSGVLGISAGGFVAHVLAIQRPQFKAMAAAISSPDWLSIDPSRTPDPKSPEGMLLGESSPVNHAGCYAPLPILMLNGELDDVVSSAGSKLLHQRLSPLYGERGDDQQLELIVYANAGHYFTDDMQAKTAEWFRRYL